MTDFPITPASQRSRVCMWALGSLILAILLRALLLETTSLIDPTETRYASVAQEMWLSGDWLTPKLHMQNGIEPYLGKPPLHFWLTASAYALFGVDEWTSRLPSLLATILTLLVIGAFANRLFGREIAAVSTLITFSSALLFFVSGGCVTDTTLTALVTASVALLYLWYSGMVRRNFLPVSAAAACALAFLCKGPVALVLTGLPFIAWASLHGELRSLFKIPYVQMIAVFLAIAAPWFVLSEIHHPGFSYYFFFNENLARFLVRDYGDRYGTGHVYIRGFAWIFLALGFLPWTPLLVISAIKQRHGALSRLRADPHLSFLVCWALSAPAFFTFARQLHALYILSAIPPLGVLCALAIRSGVPRVTAIRTGSIACAAYLAAIVVATPFVNATRSGELALKTVVLLAANSGGIPRVAITSTNAFSHYWLSKAWLEELGAPVEVRYVPIEQIVGSDAEFAVLKNSNGIPKELSPHFEWAASSGTWTVFSRIDRLARRKIGTPALQDAPPPHRALAG